jgi:hypothetical protein
MTALAADRATPAKADNDLESYGVKAATKIWAGALVVIASASGYAAGGTAATGLIAVGRAEHAVDNSAGANGDQTIKVRAGIFRFDNSTSSDLIAITEIGTTCYIVDDHTVAKTSNSSARSAAGIVKNVDAQGVWVAVGPSGII